MNKISTMTNARHDVIQSATDRLFERCLMDVEDLKLVFLHPK